MRGDLMPIRLGKKHVDLALIVSYLGTAISTYIVELYYVVAGAIVVLASMILVSKYASTRSISEAKALSYLSTTSIILGGLTGLLLNGFSSLSSILYVAGLGMLALVYSVIVSWG
ncbi:MAG: hypothetical protein QXY95_04210 [Thermosphaera sp.]